MDSVRDFFVMIGIYKITCLVNDRIYIGQSINIRNRFKVYSKINESKRQHRLYRSFNKFGIDNHTFEIIEECSVDKLNERERHWQDHYDVLGKNGLNCKLTSTNDLKCVHSDETRLKISASLTGKKLPQEVKDKMSKTRLDMKIKFPGRVRSEASKISQSIKMKGHKYNVGQPPPSDETKYKLSMSNPRNRIALNLETGIYYENCRLAADSIGMDRSHFLKVLKGKYKNNTSFIFA